MAMREVCNVMKDMGESRHSFEVEHENTVLKLQKKIDKLRMQRNDLEFQLQQGKLVPVTRRITNPDRENAKILRKQLTKHIMSQRRSKIEALNSLPISENMKTLFGGTNLNEDQ